MNNPTLCTDNGHLDEIEQLVTLASVDAGLQCRLLQFLAGEIGTTSTEEPLPEDDRLLMESLAYAAERFAESVAKKLDDAELALLDYQKAARNREGEPQPSQEGVT